VCVLAAQAARAGAGLVCLVVAGCSDGVLDPRGPVGTQERQILLNSLAIMLVIVVPTIVVALAFAWWFRASNTRARRQPGFVYSGRVELVVWSIPLLTIALLGGVIWISSHSLDPYRPLPSSKPPLEVRVVSLDWKWLFIYPRQGIASVNELVVPVGVPVHFSLTSASVMNGFFVPQLGSMVATMNGMVTQLYLQADHAGDYYGESTQFSGDGFSDMNFIVRAVPADRFEQWAAGVHRAGAALDRGAYAVLARQSANVRPVWWGSVDPGLFDAIVAQRIPPGPGPDPGRGGRAVPGRP